MQLKQKHNTLFNLKITEREMQVKRKKKKYTKLLYSFMKREQHFVVKVDILREQKYVSAVFVVQRAVQRPITWLEMWSRN